MKKQLVLVAAFVIGGFTMANAQGGGGNRMTVEERVARVHAKIDSAFKLEPAKMVQVDTAFAQYYRAQQAKMMELMSGGERPDRDAMMAAQKPFVDARDEKLKAIFTEAQFKTWKDELEPALNQRRGGGGPGNRQQ